MTGEENSAASEHLVTGADKFVTPEKKTGEDAENVAIARQAAISKSVMPVNHSALPCTSCFPETITARVGAARKNVLIQPARTEVSTSTRTPKMIPKRQAASFALSDMVRTFDRKNPVTRRISLRL